MRHSLRQINRKMGQISFLIVWGLFIVYGGMQIVGLSSSVNQQSIEKQQRGITQADNANIVEKTFWFLLGRMPEAPGNAADDYMTAFMNLQDNGSIETVHIEKGTMKKICSFYPKYFGCVLEPGDIAQAHVTNLYSFRNKLQSEGEMLEKQGKRVEACTKYGTMLLFGWHLEQDGINLAQTLAGFRIQEDAYRLLEKFYFNEVDKKELCHTVSLQIKKIIEDYEEKARLIASNDALALRTLASDEEPVFLKTWAASSLGRYEFYPFGEIWKRQSGLPSYRIQRRLEQLKGKIKEQVVQEAIDATLRRIHRGITDK